MVIVSGQKLAVVDAGVDAETDRIRSWNRAATADGMQALGEDRRR